MITHDIMTRAMFTTLLSVASLCAAGPVSKLMAQAESTDRRYSFQPGLPDSANFPNRTKLPPELWEVVEYGATYIGQNRDGRVVAEMPTAIAGNLARLSAVNEADDTIGEFIISYEGQQAPSRERLRAAGFELQSVYPPGKFVVVTPTALTVAAGGERRSAGTTADEFRALIALEEIGSVSPNYSMRIPQDSPPSILSFDELRAESHTDDELEHLWGIRSTGADVVRHELGDSELIVAVIDTGVDYLHEDLHRKMWFNERERSGTTGVDDDGNGIVDDVFGAAFVLGSSTGNPRDDNGHGTHCAGTIAAVANRRGVVGMASVRIMALKFLDHTGRRSSVTDAVKCIDYACDNGARIISASWGGPVRAKPLQEAIQRAQNKGVLFIAAAGNAGSDNDSVAHFPSNFPEDNVISVGAVGFHGQLAEYSNRGLTMVDLGAPGGSGRNAPDEENILSTWLDNRYAYTSGTSMATPHVAGAAALILSHPAFRGATFVDVKAALFQHARHDARLGSAWAEGRVLDVSFLKSAAGPAPPIRTGASDTSEQVATNEQSADESTIRPNMPAESDTATDSNTRLTANAASGLEAAGVDAGSEFTADGNDAATAEDRPRQLRADTGNTQQRLPRGQFFHDPPASFTAAPLTAESTTSDWTLVTREITVTEHVRIHLQAGTSIGSPHGDVTISTGFSISHQHVRPSYRLVTVPGQHHYANLITSATAALAPGRHIIQWWVRVPASETVQIAGGGGLSLQAFVLGKPPTDER